MRNLEITPRDVTHKRNVNVEKYPKVEGFQFNLSEAVSVLAKEII